MLGLALRLLRPGHALTVLLLFGAWQGYSFVKSIPDKLSGRPAVQSAAQVQPGATGGQRNSNRDMPEPTPGSSVVEVVRRIHPLARILYWSAAYILLCFAGVPLIKRALGCESNLVNAAVVAVYCAVGVAAAMALVAFRLTWLTALWIIVALVCSAALIIALAAELERLRVEDAVA